MDPVRLPLGKSVGDCLLWARQLILVPESTDPCLGDRVECCLPWVGSLMGQQVLPTYKCGSGIKRQHKNPTPRSLVGHVPAS